MRTQVCLDMYILTLLMLFMVAFGATLYYFISPSTYEPVVQQSGNARMNHLKEMQVNG